MPSATWSLNRDVKRRYQREWKRRRYAEARQLLGGCCVRCYATQDLEIDHIDPVSKLYRITDALSMRREVWLAELAKCQLLCTDCHADKNDEDAAAEAVPF